MITKAAYIIQAFRNLKNLTDILSRKAMLSQILLKVRRGVTVKIAGSRKIGRWHYIYRAFINECLSLRSYTIAFGQSLELYSARM